MSEALDLVTLRAFSAGLHTRRPCRNRTAACGLAATVTLGPRHTGRHADDDQRDGADTLYDVLARHRAPVPTARSIPTAAS
ncbi:MAG: hypothetical protein DMD99_00775 [Candidatus Rokuibacteriota bacterium]|nr:MAG: hypothetical protein DMD99_00775 [Candidatus Rokubacteria bacterium]